jgi:hypothetical protein
MSPPTFAAEASVYRTDARFEAVMRDSNKLGSVYAASCKCDWWEWILDPGGCAARQGYCKDPVYPPGQVCKTQSCCAPPAFVLYCKDVCVDPRANTPYTLRDWYACGPCFAGGCSL